MLFFLLGYAQVFRVVNVKAICPNLDFALRIFIVCAYFCVGPLVYLVFRSVVDRRLELCRRDFIHFIPFPIALLITVVAVAFFGLSPNYESGLIAGTIILAMAWTGAYGGIAVVRMIAVIRRMRPEARKKIRLGILFMVVALVVVGLDIANRLLPIDIEDAVLMATSGLFVGYALLAVRHPEYLSIIQEEARRIRYQHSRLSNIDVQSTVASLEAKMQVERLFLQHDLTLSKLADAIGISPHQLSEILNTRYERNFSSFVNEYRVLEAKRRLVRDQDQTVLTIAYAVGFGTPSAFYAAFKKATGVSPATYRKCPQTA